ncbi:hypothetical protein GCM10023346_11940 [Arthrobacter gyeryongensis]|uniref:Uncharacterized protein n=1 Tax=Arthrobacter gyeryongensis TaxID=1650592 RepID=A0ABP9S765_9MICC
MCLGEPASEVPDAGCWFSLVSALWGGRLSCGPALLSTGELEDLLEEAGVVESAVALVDSGGDELCDDGA